MAGNLQFMSIEMSARQYLRDRAMAKSYRAEGNPTADVYQWEANKIADRFRKMSGIPHITSELPLDIYTRKKG